MLDTFVLSVATKFDITIISVELVNLKIVSVFLDMVEFEISSEDTYTWEATCLQICTTQGDRH